METTIRNWITFTLLDSCPADADFKNMHTIRTIQGP